MQPTWVTRSSTSLAERATPPVAASARMLQNLIRCLLRRAQATVDYRFGHRLLERHYDHLGRAYLTRSIRHAYMLAKSLV
jgi:hypothetical protein